MPVNGEGIRHEVPVEKQKTRLTGGKSQLIGRRKPAKTGKIPGEVGEGNGSKKVQGGGGSGSSAPGQYQVVQK